MKWYLHYLLTMTLWYLSRQFFYLNNLPIKENLWLKIHNILLEWYNYSFNFRNLKIKKKFVWLIHHQKIVKIYVESTHHKICLLFFVYYHTTSKQSGRINSMNQHFWLQNIKIYHKNNKKCHFAKYSSLHEATYQHQFLDDIFIFVSSKNWC